MKDKIILTDADGVCLDWEDHFHKWMQSRGYDKVRNDVYYLSDQYQLTSERSKNLVEEFNSSAWIGWCPAFRDAKSGIATLCENGYRFICITSLGLDPYAQKLRWQNLNKLFGDEAFVELICLDTGSDKDQELRIYQDSGLWWIEDKWENAVTGAELGLKSIIVDHRHNEHQLHEKIFRAKNWKDICSIIL